MDKLKIFHTELFNWKIYRTPGLIDYWLIDTVPMDKQGMTVRPGVDGGIYTKKINLNQSITS